MPTVRTSASQPDVTNLDLKQPYTAKSQYIDAHLWLIRFDSSSQAVQNYRSLRSNVVASAMVLNAK
jgi:hypothetical protein